MLVGWPCWPPIIPSGGAEYTITRRPISWDPLIMTLSKGSQETMRHDLSEVVSEITSYETVLELTED